MNKDEILQLMSSGLFMGVPINGKLEETNISWVLLGDKYVFKIKKPVKLSFLDYSTLALRKLNCEKELELNKRFSPIYLSVLPVSKFQGNWIIGESEGDIVDYSVCMLKMDSNKRMDLLLGKNKVKKDQVLLLAKQVVQFHRSAIVIQKEIELDSMAGIFNDLLSVSDIVSQFLDQKYGHQISTLVFWSDEFLASNIQRFKERIREGFTRDVHGDLHSRNIFLYKEPIIFDCIEFEESFRQIDVLYEVAFICMDLEYFGRSDFSDLFLKTYLSAFDCMPKAEDKQIFLYYKSLRANIRAKVNLLHAKSEPDSKRRNLKLESASKYLELAVFYKESMKLD
jgi:aminoglycoside phosphotransferase family enzyme